MSFRPFLFGGTPYIPPGAQGAQGAQGDTRTAPRQQANQIDYFDLAQGVQGAQTSVLATAMNEAQRMPAPVSGVVGQARQQRLLAMSREWNSNQGQGVQYPFYGARSLDGEELDGYVGPRSALIGGDTFSFGPPVREQRPLNEPPYFSFGGSGGQGQGAPYTSTSGFT